MSPQQAIAHYRVASKLGQGGMGEVWRATDTKLNRDVALKVLPEAFAQDAGRMARLTREAQVLASLNHPNIAAIYGVEDRALVLELVEGPTLAERIAQGAIPIEEALGIARQIAEALEYAHEHGVVHRDLKPANIKIATQGRIKVLDFGLAKATAGEAPAGNPNMSPTLTMRETMAGTILGTAAYMSPEQARGQEVNKRADIWAFGVVLYEMLTGRQLFGGSTVSDTLAAVLKGEIDLSAAPAAVRPVLDRCLRRDASERWHCMGDAGAALSAETPAPAPAGRRALPWMVASVLAIVAAYLAAGLWRATRPVDHPPTHLSVDLGPDAVTGFDNTVALSPDGRRIVFPVRGPDGKQQLATRLLDQSQTALLPGTGSGFDPVFSPDGQTIAFFAAGQLKKISLQGGSPLTLCNSPSPRGVAWSEDGSLVVAITQLSPLSRIPATGGVPQRITKLGAGEIGHRWPQVLPGGRVILFSASRTNTGADDSTIEALSVKTGQVKILLHGGYYGRYVPGGYLIYVKQGTLFGVRFDPDRLEVQGAPVPLVDDVAANPITGGGQFDFASGPASGALAYLAGKGAAQSLTVSWLDNTGAMQPLTSTPGLYTAPRFSPDGRQLLIVVGSDVYVHDLERNTNTQLTFGGYSVAPVWAPDGKHLVYTAVSDSFRLTWIRSNGSGQPQVLWESRNNLVPWSFPPDGSRLAYHEYNLETGGDLWTLPLDISDPDHPKPGKPEVFLTTAAEELVPRFSPDGRWIAYRSNESGANEIYVRPFPPTRGGKWQISTGGGIYALWSKTGRELFYESADGRIMVLDYSVDGDAFVPGNPRLWSKAPVFQTGVSNLDLAPDGKRFAVLTAPEAAAYAKGSVHVTFLLNFFDELKRRMP